jgi:hypothetical protein
LVELRNVSCGVFLIWGRVYFVATIILPRLTGLEGGVWLKLHYVHIWVKVLNLDAADEVGWQWPELMADLAAEYYAARGHFA